MTQRHFPRDSNLPHALAVSRALLTATQTILQYIIVQCQLISESQNHDNLGYDAV